MIRIIYEKYEWDSYYMDLTNRLDRLARTKRELTDYDLDILDSLAEHSGLTVEDLAEEFGCEGCYDWLSLIDALRSYSDMRIPA